MSKSINYAKDAWIWSADAVEAHPHWTLSLILALAASRLVF